MADAHTLDAWQDHLGRHQMMQADEDTTPSTEETYRHCKARLVREWSCPLPAHGVCIVGTTDQVHYGVSERGVDMWARAICRGEASVHPPGYVMSCGRHVSVYLKALEEGACRPEAILAALLRHNHQPPPSIFPSLGIDFTSFPHPSPTFPPPRRYQSVKAIKWLPTRLLNTQDSDLVIRRRMVQHLLRLREWQAMRHLVVDGDMQGRLFEIIEDVVEMSRACYSRRAKKDAAFIGLEMQRWLLSCPGAALTQTTAPWLCRLHVSLAPIFLGGIYLHQSLPLCNDVSAVQPRLEDWLDIITDMRLDINTASAIIERTARCLSDLPYVHPYTPLLGENLVRTLETVQHMRPLNAEEVSSISLMAARRLETTQEVNASTRPWELVLIAQCTAYEPLLRHVVLGPTGLRHLLHALKALPRPWSQRRQDRKHMVDIVGAVRCLAGYAWVLDAVDPGLVALWDNLRRGGILEHLFMERVETLATAQTAVTAAYSPVTGRRTVAHKTGAPSLEGPLVTLNELTPLEEFYKEQAGDGIKRLCVEMRRGAGGTNAVAPQAPQSPPPQAGMSVAPVYANVLSSSPTSDASSFNWSYASYASSAPSRLTSLMPGIGYLSAKALHWIGEGTLDTVTNAIIWKRTGHHLHRLRRWQKRRCAELDTAMQRKVFSIVHDALDLSDPWCSDRVNHYATSIGVELQQWLMSSVDASVTAQHTALIIRIHICICTTLLATYAKTQSEASLQQLLETVQRVPLDVDDPGVTVLAIRIIAKEIAHSSCSVGRTKLEMSLVQILQASLHARSLTIGEMDAIREVWVGRRQQSAGWTAENCQPWQVAIFAECASQDTTFGDAIFGDYGIPSLIPVLQGILSTPTLSPTDLDNVECIVSVLHHLSRHAWIAQAIDPGTVGLLMNVFSRTDTHLRYHLRHLAVQATLNIVSCPGVSRACLADMTAPASSWAPQRDDDVLERHFNASMTSLRSAYTIGEGDGGAGVVVHPGTHDTPAVHVQMCGDVVAPLDTGGSHGDSESALSCVGRLYPPDVGGDRWSMPGAWEGW